MKRVYISNHYLSDFYGSFGRDDFEIEHFNAPDITGNTIYIIDVHYRLSIRNKRLALQNQGGLTIYRILLKQFKGREDKLKVIFYSPIPAKQLVMLNPENYVLILLPFIELLEENEKSINSNTDWSFEDCLKDKISIYTKTGWPQLNNASENLLSGWSLSKKSLIKNGEFEKAKINLIGNKALVIDDEFSSWSLTYSNIIRDAENSIFPSKYKSQKAIREAWKNGNALREIISKTSVANFVISDLYIFEDHERTRPYKTINEIRGVSGFKVFEEIKAIFPYLPYMIYTTSNKIWNVDAFRSEGIWAWAIKDNSEKLNCDDKISQFEHFQSCLLKVSIPSWKYVTKIWQELISIQSKGNLDQYWWHSDCSIALDIIKDCLLTLDAIYSQRSNFETNQISYFTARQCSQIFNNLGGLCEKLQIHFGGGRSKTVGAYIYMIRSFYSHELFYRNSNPLEAVFCVGLLLKFLKQSPIAFKNQPSSVKFVIEKKFVDNTNLNYLLQFEALSESVNQIKYDKELLHDLKKAFSGVSKNILSSYYKKTNKDHKWVIDLVNNHLTEQLPSIHA